MLRKICPICDHVMKYPHYCGNCKTWVKVCNVQNVNYYLNESHPKGEQRCSYHGIGGSERAETVSGSTGKSEGVLAEIRPEGQVLKNQNRADSGLEKNSTEGGTAGWVSQNTSVPPAFYETADKEKGTRREPKGILWVFVTMTVVVTAAFVVKSFVAAARNKAVSDLYSHLEQAEEQAELYEGDGWEYGDGEDFEDDWGSGEEWDFYDDWDYEDDYVYVEDEDVIAAGIACNELGHFNISQLEMKERTRQILGKHGYTADQTSQDSYNVEMPDYEGDTVSSEYSTYFRYDIRESDDWMDENEYVELDYDTATGEIHGIEVMVKDKDELVSLSLELLEQLEEGSGLPEGMWSVSVRRDMPGVLDIGDGYWLMAGNVSIRGYRYDDEYYFYISLWNYEEDFTDEEMYMQEHTYLPNDWEKQLY